MTFEDHGVADGCWTGALRADRQPDPPCVIHRGAVVAQARLRDAGPGVWAVEADLPGTVIDQGAHGLLLVVGEPGAPGSQVLARLTLVSGQVAGDELLAEVAHLRAELDLLKREFRRLAAGG